MKKLMFLWGMAMCVNLAAQKVPGWDPDITYFKAREMAFNGLYADARDSLTRILSHYPEYTDVRSLLGSIHSWEGNYPQARAELNRITSRQREHKEAWIAAVKNEIYAGNFSLALGMANKANTFLGNAPEIAVLKQQILVLNQRRIDSLNPRPIEQVITPEQSTELNFASLYNRIGMYSEAFIYTGDFDPVVLTGLEYERSAGIGKVIGRINHAYRFDQHGLQAEIDLYPRFSKAVYTYFNYGYSKSPVFPIHRAGAEVFVKVAEKWEVSAGAKYLEFADAPVTIYTASVGWYPGNHFLNLRPYITPRDDGTTSVSAQLTGRKYRDDRERFIGFNLVYGISPELRALRSGDTLLAETLLYVENQLVNLEYQFTLKNTPHIFRATVGAGRQEFAAIPGEFYWAVMGGLRYHTAF